HEGSRPRPVNVQVVDPARYPLVGRPHFTAPRGRDLRSLIGQPNQAVIDTTAQSELGVYVGDQIELVSQLAAVKLTVAGILAGGGAGWGEPERPHPGGACFPGARRGSEGSSPRLPERGPPPGLPAWSRPGWAWRRARRGPRRARAQLRCGPAHRERPRPAPGA